MHADTGKSQALLRGIALFCCVIYFFSAVRTPTEPHIIDVVNLIFHEAGHTLFSIGPELLMVLGGSLMQVLIPLLLVLYFAFRGEFFSSSILLFWLGHSIINVSVYAGDAFLRQLPLLGGDGVIHDWAYLSAHLGLGRSVLTLSKFLHALGALTILIGLVWSLFNIAKDRQTKT